MAAVNTIVFGATGAVGSAAAQTAKEKGANVFLAVRDLTKPLPDIIADQEKEKGFTRVWADLTQPDSLRKAVVATGATRAFVYMASGTPDNMKASLEALKSAGVDFVVFLSSSGIRGDPRQVKPEDPISWRHAQVEIGLQEIFGESGHISVRPGSFASNTLWWKEMIQAGDVKLAYPQATNDAIAPQDTGRVSGAALARGPSVLSGLEHNILRVYGPKLLSQGEQVAIIGRVLGKEVKVTTISEEEEIGMVARLIPEAFARILVGGFKVRAGLTEDDGFYAEPGFAEATSNIEKYGGKPPTRFEEWVEGNKVLFQ